MTTSGLRALRKVHIGAEGLSAQGTAVDPTLFLVGALTPRLNQQLYRPDNLDTGRLALHERSIITYQQADLRFESDANYEQIEHLLKMSVAGGVNAAGDAFLNSPFTFEPDYEAFNNYVTYSFYYGDNEINWRATRVQAQQLTFSGQVNDVIKVSARMFGQNMLRLGTTDYPLADFPDAANPAMIGSGYVDAPGDADLTAAIVNTGHFYTGTSWDGLETRAGAINAAAVTTGADQHMLRPATLADFNYTINTGLAPLPYVDGEISYTDVAQARRGVEANLTIAINDDDYAAELYDAHLAQDLQFFGLQFADGTRKLDLQLSGHVTDYGELAEREGQSIVRIQFQSTYDRTGEQDMAVLLTT